METLELGDIVCRVKYSKRKTICLRAAKDGMAEILAPKGMSENQIKKFMLPYSRRIASECQRQRKRIAMREAFFLDYGSYVRLLGKVLEIRAGKSAETYADSAAVYLPDSLGREDIRRTVIDFYKRCAKEYLTRRVEDMSAKMGLSPSAVKVNSAASHWASCSRGASLNFSWFCIMASPEAVDYIIIHELCHMCEFNHSPRFWSMVALYCPEYKKHKEYLKGLWREIICENWVE